MRFRKFFILFLAVAVTGGMVLGMSSCKERDQPHVDHYTCPMHPQIRTDEPGKCPLCGMDLIPVEKEKPHGEGGHQHGSTALPGGETGIRIDPTRVQNIGVKIFAAARRPLVRRILAYGKVAHDSDLWVAQNEYLEALKLGDHSLIKSSELKLKFLGLSPEWIELLKKERKSDLGLHLPTQNTASYFEAFLPQADVGLAKVGQGVEILDEGGQVLQRGSVAAIGTIVDPATRLVRLLVKSAEAISFKSNAFVQFRIETPVGERLSIPTAAILFNGDHNMVYVASDGGLFVPRRVEVGVGAEGYSEILKGVQEGEMVVTNGHFLIDSETQIKMGTGSTHRH